MSEEGAVSESTYEQENPMDSGRDLDYIRVELKKDERTRA